MRKLLLVIFSFLALTNISSTNTNNIVERKEEIQIITSQPLYEKPSVIEYDSLYKEVLQSIRDFESLRLIAYLCPANQKTIGYGHFIKPTDTIRDTITLAEAEYLLREDFNNCINAVEKYLENVVIDNRDVKVLALAHFTYNVGKGNLKNSQLLQKVKQNLPIDDELLKWIHYRNKDGELVASEYIKQMRQYEVDLINSVS